MAPSVLPRSTCYIASPCACCHGATISAARAIGPRRSAAWSRPAAPINSGRCWRRGRSMSTELSFDQIRLPPECDALRNDVRAFIAEEVAKGTFVPDRPGHGDTHDGAFSRRVGAKGWIGMSEPGSGSDLFAAKAKATRTNEGWRINGSKIWTSNAHVADYMIGLFRTSPPAKDNRRHGLTQFLIDMKAPGITVNPIYQMTGQHDFNEVVFDDAFMTEDHVLGEIDGAWKQATSELAYERSGPERFLETFYVLN